MRIKIFLFPIIMIIALYLVIAHIFPDLQNSRLVGAEITKKEEELKKIEDRQAHIATLFQSFAQNRIDYEEVLTAVPYNRDTEFVINQIGKLVQNHGMTLALMGFEDGQKQKRRNTRIVSVADDVDTSRAELEKIRVSASIAGPYENMRGLLSEIFFLGRAGQFLNVNIERVQAGDSEDGAEPVPQDYLTMEIAFDYYVMPQFRVAKPANFSHPIVDDPSRTFDYSKVALWRDRLVTGLSGISQASGRGGNPFLP